MRVLVDTNVVISALLFPNSAPGEVLAQVLAGERLVLTRWIIDELHEVVFRKRPDLWARPQILTPRAFLDSRPA